MEGESQNDEVLAWFLDNQPTVDDNKSSLHILEDQESARFVLKRKPSSSLLLDIPNWGEEFAPPNKRLSRFVSSSFFNTAFDEDADLEIPLREEKISDSGESRHHYFDTYCANQNKLGLFANKMEELKKSMKPSKTVQMILWLLSQEDGFYGINTHAPDPLWGLVCQVLGLNEKQQSALVRSRSLANDIAMAYHLIEEDFAKMEANLNNHDVADGTLLEKALAVLSSEQIEQLVSKAECEKMHSMLRSLLAMTRELNMDQIVDLKTGWKS